MSGRLAVSIDESNSNKIKIGELQTVHTALKSRNDDIEERLKVQERAPVAAHVNEKLSSLQTITTQCQSTIGSTVAASQATVTRIATLDYDQGRIAMKWNWR